MRGQALIVNHMLSRGSDVVSLCWAPGLLRLSPHSVFVGVIAGSGRINNTMHFISTSSYSTLWAISVPQPIHSVLAAEWITAWTDPCLFPPPPLIFLALTFIEAFPRNTPLAIHFLKWSYGEKAHGVGVRMCGIYKWAKQFFLWFFFFSSFLVESLCFCVFSSFSFVFCFLLLNPFSPLPPIPYLLRDAVQPFKSVLQRGVFELSHGSIWKPLHIHPWEGLILHHSQRSGAQWGFWDAACSAGLSLTGRVLQLNLPLPFTAPG